MGRKLSYDDMVARAREAGFTPAFSRDKWKGTKVNGKKVKYPWTHLDPECGETRTQEFHNMLEGKCGGCAEGGGYRTSRSGYFYLMERDYYGSTHMQIGITNVPKRRIATHESEGYRLLELIGPMDGQLIWDTEKAVKDQLDALGWLLHGETERWEATCPEKYFTTLAEFFAYMGVGSPKDRVPDFQAPLFAA